MEIQYEQLLIDVRRFRITVHLHNYKKVQDSSCLRATGRMFLLILYTDIPVIRVSIVELHYVLVLV